MEKLFKYFMDETNKRFDKIDLILGDLQAFKAGMLVESKRNTLIISCTVSMGAAFLSHVATYLLRKYG